MNLEQNSPPILLVEDDEVDIQDIRRNFIKNNVCHPLYVSVNAIEALDKLLGVNGKSEFSPLPVAILLDLNMPKMNGIEFLKRLRAEPKLNSMCVFILTSSNADKDRLAAYKLNVSGYMLKPINRGDFTNFLDVVARKCC